MRLYSVITIFCIVCSPLFSYAYVTGVDRQVFDVVIPGPHQGESVRNPFIEELLALIFTNQKLTLNLIYHQQELGQNRVIKQLSENIDIDLNWSVTNTEREQKLFAIKHPIYQGLIGWRVLLILPSKSNSFKAVKSINDLMKYTAVQRFDWADFGILKENNLPVEGNFSYINHSKAVVDGLVDYFPRSVLEARREISTQRNKNLIIEEDLLLKYPSAHYFFVNKNNKTLANIINNGFKELIENGQYQALFSHYFAENLKALKLKNRTVIHLTNSSMPQK